MPLPPSSPTADADRAAMEASSHPRPPQLSAVVVHWRNGDHLQRLLESWPQDPRFEMLVVDNSAAEIGPTHPHNPAPARWLRPAANLGFAGGANLGARHARAPWILLLNPDARPLPGALDALLEGIRAHPEVAGLAPALENEDGSPQHRWQLRPLPTPKTLLWQCLFLPAGQGPSQPPAPGAAVEQPAAAALALRRQPLLDLGGLDDGFYPAWFEDVDLARRLADAGHQLLYWPSAGFVHAMGASVSSLGYGSFSWIYYRGLVRYLEIHHGRRWRNLARLTLAAGALLRLAALPLRRPRRARGRRAAAAALARTARGAITNFRQPADLAYRYQRPSALNEEPETGS